MTDYLPSDASPLMNSNLKHQIELIQDDIESLWLIGSYIHLAPQGTSFNEGLHSYLSCMKPKKTSKLTYDTLEMMVGICLLNFNRKYTFLY